MKKEHTLLWIPFVPIYPDGLCFVGFKNLLPAALPNSVRNAKCPGFSHVIKIWHFWQYVWTFLVSHSGRKHLQEDSHQPATDRKWEEEKDEDVFVRDHIVWTQTAKDEELICKESSVSELSIWLSLLLHRASCRFTNYDTTNKCTNCMSFIFKSLFKTLSLLLHVSTVYRLSSSGSTYSS